ncbi:hypothetical protein NDU88_010967 [Pleurodeles waltl]|uniref:Uncharacterized protein n=1 Tax=Pleurodeles waltl TaxID=8319 RepID=A0AAV7S147_PLEWA|nr:hypothetical protein NDU88_010967 [Pleurodeles waltl]
MNCCHSNPGLCLLTAPQPSSAPGTSHHTTPWSYASVAFLDVAAHTGPDTDDLRTSMGADRILTSPSLCPRLKRANGCKNVCEDVKVNHHQVQ